MRYRLAALMLIAVLPKMHVLAAPASDPVYAILEIGPPPEGWTEERSLQDQIKFMTSPVTLDKVFRDPEVRKLPSVAAMKVKDVPSWLEKGIRVTPEKERRRLRITFRGKLTDQVTIINALLGVRLSVDRETIQSCERNIRKDEDLISKLESSKNPTDNDREMIHDLRTIRIPKNRVEIARLKLTKVIKWPK